MLIDMSLHHEINVSKDGGPFFSKNTSWWRNLFQDLEAQHKIDISSDMSKECLWYCFSKLLQEESNTVREHWNTHYIRGFGKIVLGEDQIHYISCQNIMVPQVIYYQVLQLMK